MLLELENQLHKRIHNTLGQSAVVLRLAEELDQSGRVAEQTMIIINYSGGNTDNPFKGAGIPTVRNRSVNFSVSVVQKQVQREGHSFALPILDLIYDAVSGWIPEVPGLEFRTGFEPSVEKFVELTEASQFIYQMNFTIDVSASDGRFYSSPCAAFDSIQIGDFLPRRTCLLAAPSGKNTGLAIWRRKTKVGEEQEYVVLDTRCPRQLGDRLDVQCSEAEDGRAIYRFIPRDAISVSSSGTETIDESKVISGQLCNVWKCTKGSTGDYPDWFKLNIETGLWRNQLGTVPNTEPETAARQDLKISPKKSYQ